MVNDNKHNVHLRLIISIEIQPCYYGIKLTHYYGISNILDKIKIDCYNQGNKQID